jgi:hypothetical protein
MIADGAEGFLTEARDPAAFADALEKVLGDPLLAERLGSHGRSTAVARFSLEKTSRELKYVLVLHAAIAPPAAACADDPQMPRPGIFAAIRRLAGC